MLAILPAVELVEHPVGEGPEALGADEARGVEELAVRVDNLGFWLKAIVTTRTGDALQVHDARHPVEEVGALGSRALGGAIRRQAALGQCVGTALLLLSRCAALRCLGPARLPGSARPHTSSSSFSSSSSSTLPSPP